MRFKRLIESWEKGTQQHYHCFDVPHYCDETQQKQECCHAHTGKWTQNVLLPYYIKLVNIKGRL